MKILLVGGCGYIGSSLHETLSKKHDVIVWDILRRSECHDLTPRNQDEIEQHLITQVDLVILVSGCSSVPESNQFPIRCWKENVTDFIRLVDMLPNHIPLIYASSASVYNGLDKVAREEDTLGTPINMYDLSKNTADRIATQFPEKRLLGLRLSTVNGTSPNMRHELMLNKMVKDARETGYIKVSNATAIRPILGMNDLCNFISKLTDDLSIIMRPEVINLCSFTSTIGQLAHDCSEITRSKIVDIPNVPTYSFAIDNQKSIEWGFQPNDTLAALVKDLT